MYRFGVSKRVVQEMALLPDKSFLASEETDCA
jgi:hypothetical protein